ncbi:hypothetical protein [Halomonas sp. ND22Bw]|uniref:hypothetical protein n=1 Tax=Halomonas sp. ND22Bw TaxID=2054178 RepID=UPI0011B275F4
MRVLMLAGNGLSLSMLNDCSESSVDLVNLFRLGSDVPWPATGAPGFLSYEHCPNLWALGARQSSTKEESYAVIETIITAVNACCMADPSTLEDGIYIKAYKELVSYLRYLFVYYDDLLKNKGFFEKVDELATMKALSHVARHSDVDHLDIVTFNYDAMLERCFNSMGIDYSIPKLKDSEGANVSIHKPHGSITFCGRQAVDKSAFGIKYAAQFSEGGLDDLCVRYDYLGENYPMVGILPPAGESDRYKHRWIREIWDGAGEAVSKLGDDDLIILYGLSYWHVDRKEIDHLLAKVPRKAKVISINPSPSNQLDAVCCSLFKSYHSYSHPALLEKVLP